MLDHTILRPTNAYGCPEHPEVHRWSLVPDCFCESAVRDGEIVIRSSGLQYKDFIYLGRLAGLTYEVCRRFERFRGQAINLAGGTACTIRDVAAQVRDEYVALTGRPCVIRVLSDDPPAREPLVVAGPPTATLPVDPALESDLRTEIGKTLRYLTT